MKQNKIYKYRYYFYFVPNAYNSFTLLASSSKNSNFHFFNSSSKILDVIFSKSSRSEIIYDLIIKLEIVSWDKQSLLTLIYYIIWRFVAFWISTLYQAPPTSWFLINSSPPTQTLRGTVTTPRSYISACQQTTKRRFIDLHTGAGHLLFLYNKRTHVAVAN